MSEQNEPKKAEKPKKTTKKLPQQKSATDTSNWDDREFMTPSGRVVIETREDAVNDEVITS